MGEESGWRSNVPKKERENRNTAEGEGIVMEQGNEIES